MPSVKVITGNGLWSLGETGPEVMGSIHSTFQALPGLRSRPSALSRGTDFTPAACAYARGIDYANLIVIDFAPLHGNGALGLHPNLIRLKRS